MATPNGNVECGAAGTIRPFNLFLRRRRNEPKIETILTTAAHVNAGASIHGVNMMPNALGIVVWLSGCLVVSGIGYRIDKNQDERTEKFWPQFLCR
jgi:hypothetical protein